jgi:peptidyl-prolyl cis-trans isomerase A (cyclophilin A)
MARISDPDSASSQFFINQADNLGLDIGNYQVYYEYYMGNFYPVTAKLPGYAVFGQVISGMDIVEVIAAIPTENGVDVPDIGTFDDVPVNDIIIETAVLSSPVCLEKLEGDIDGDCDVDLADFAKLAANWLECNAINDCQ